MTSPEKEVFLEQLRRLKRQVEGSIAYVESVGLVDDGKYLTEATNVFMVGDFQIHDFQVKDNRMKP
jgi:hypothetical protein